MVEVEVIQALDARAGPWSRRAVPGPWCRTSTARRARSAGPADRVMRNDQGDERADRVPPATRCRCRRPGRPRTPRSGPRRTRAAVASATRRSQTRPPLEGASTFSQSPLVDFTDCTRSRPLLVGTRLDHHRQIVLDSPSRRQRPRRPGGLSNSAASFYKISSSPALCFHVDVSESFIPRPSCHRPHRCSERPCTTGIKHTAAGSSSSAAGRCPSSTRPSSRSTRPSGSGSASSTSATWAV